MNSIQRLTAVLVAFFLLASCASFQPPATGLQRPLPAEFQVLCPQPPAAPGVSGEVDPVAAALKEMYDLYAICAGMTAERLKWDEQETMRDRPH